MNKNGTTSIQVQQEQYSNFCKQVVMDTLLGHFTKTFNYKSTREIQDEYGLSCANIFKLLFIKYQKGGRTLSGKAYKTIWAVDEENGAIFQHINHQFKNVDITAKQVLQEMLAKGCTYKERVKFWNEDFTHYDAEIFGGAELTLAKQLKKQIADRDQYVEAKKVRESLR